MNWLNKNLNDVPMVIGNYGKNICVYYFPSRGEVVLAELAPEPK